MTDLVQWIAAVWIALWSFGWQEDQSSWGSGSTPPVTPTISALSAGETFYTLSRPEFTDLAREAGFHRDAVVAEAYRVACGGGATTWGESACRPDATNGRCHGLLAICPEFWDWLCPDIGTTWSDPSYNLWCAREIVRYEEANGLHRWSHWDAQP